MSQADELLESLAATPATAGEGSREDHIVVGMDRVIVVPEALKEIGVQYDHNMETVTFDCIRFWDGIDMSTMKVYINYMRADNHMGMYLCEPVTVEDDVMHFDWTISGDVTNVQGNLSFIVCIKKTDAEGNEENHWNSKLCTDMYISEGLKCQESVLRRFPDIITQLLTRMDATEVRQQEWEEATYEELDGRMKIAEGNTTPEEILKRINEALATNEDTQQTIYNSVTTYLEESDKFIDQIENTVDTYLDENPPTVPVDATLKVAGAAADAEATGLAIDAANAKTDALGVEMDALAARTELIVKSSNDGVLEGSVAGGLQVVSVDGNSEQVQWSGKNLISCSGLVEKTSNGITFTPVYDSNGLLAYINVNGTAGAGGIHYDVDWTFELEPGKTYVATGCPSGGGNSAHRQVFVQRDSSNTSINVAYDDGNGGSLTAVDGVEKNLLYILIAAGTVCNNLKFYPMIREASITDATYEPYIGGVEMVQGGWRNDTGVFAPLPSRVGTKGYIPCKTGDVLKIDTTKDLWSMVNFYNNGVFMSYLGDTTNKNTASYTVPEEATHFTIMFGAEATDILPLSTIGKISLTVNGKPIYIRPSYVEMMQGYYASASGAYASSTTSICSKDKIPCKPSDVIKVGLAVTTTLFRVAYYNGDTFLKVSDYDNTNSVTSAVPESATHFAFSFNGYNLETAGTISLTINDVAVSVRTTPYVIPASPNPYYPQEIEGVGNYDEESGKYIVPVKTSGKNLLQTTATSTTVNGITFTVNDDRSVTVKGTATNSAALHLNNSVRELFENGNYIISGGATSIEVMAWLYDANKAYIRPAYSTGTEATFTIEDGGAKYVTTLIQIGSGKTVDTTVYPMIREASIEDATYEPYKSNTIYIPLNEPLRKVGNVADRIVEKDGVWGVERNIGVHIAEVTTINTYGNYNYTALFPDNYKKEINNPAICDRALHRDPGAVDGTFYQNAGNVVLVGSLDDTLETLQAKYDGAILHYILATPTFTPFDQDTQVALNRLVTYNGVTYLSFGSTIQPSGFEVEYGVNKLSATLAETQNTAQQALIIAKGANEGRAFDDYKDAFAALNAMDNLQLREGQNIHIGTIGVPDLWVFSVEDTHVPYTYTTDEDFVLALGTSGKVQVGYYYLAHLETQKVDLTDYAKKVDVPTFRLEGTTLYITTNNSTES